MHVCVHACVCECVCVCACDMASYASLSLASRVPVHYNMYKELSMITLFIFYCVNITTCTFKCASFHVFSVNFFYKVESGFLNMKLNIV